MPAIPWSTMEAEWVTNSGVTYSALGKKHGVSLSSIRKYSQKAGWGAKRRDFNRRLIERAQEKAVEEIADLAVSHMRDHLGKLRDLAQKAIGRRMKELEADADHMETDRQSIVTKELTPAVRNAQGMITTPRKLTSRQAIQRRRTLSKFDESCVRQYTSVLTNLVFKKKVDEPDGGAPPLEIE